MSRGSWLAAVVATCIIIIVWWPGAAHADETNSVGLVVAIDDAHYIVRTVPLDGESITGLDLLEQCGLGVSYSQDFICSIAGVGCEFPDQDCLCALPLYWAYHHWIDEAWAYSGVGAAGWSLSSGDVDGWTWGSSVSLADVEAETLFDASRLMPGVPTFTPTTDAIGVEIPCAGDIDGDATVAACWQMADGRLIDAGALTRSGDRFEGVVLLPETPGTHELTIICIDPDGVNGSAVWTHSIVIEGTYILQCPLVLGARTSDR